MVMHECVGPTQNNGLGAAYTLLGEALADAGHHVTFLYATTKCSHGTLQEWTRHYRDRSIDFVVMPASDGTDIRAPEWLAVPYRIYIWLKDKNFDIIHYPEYPGNGYFVALAKHQRLAFRETLLCIGIHGPSMWSRAANGYRVDSVRHLAMDFMERRCAAMSDVLTAPSQSIMQWLERQEWSLPELCYVQQNIQSPHALALGGKPRKQERLTEIVFFGRIEPRKGYRLFCDAIDLLPPALLRDLAVTFLGSSVRLYEGDTADEVRRRTARWPCTTRLLTNKTHEEALAYLHASSCLAVMPSRDEVMGYVVMECIGAGIPFLASDAAGIPELMDDEDRKRVCFSPVTPQELANRIEDALNNGLAAARPAVSFEDNKRQWIDWHTQVPTSYGENKKNTDGQASPLVSILVIPAGDSDMVEKTRNSFAAQTYAHIEVVETAANARGSYILVADAGIIARPHQIQTLIDVAEHTGAAVVTSGYDSPSNEKADSGETVIRRVFLGGAAIVGAFLNIYGGNCALVRADVFATLGELNRALEPEKLYRDFYARAVLNEYEFEAVPEALYLCPAKADAGDIEIPYDPARLTPILPTLPEGLRKIILSSST